MNLWQKLTTLLTFQEPKQEPPFELLETSDDNQTASGNQGRKRNKQQSPAKGAFPENKQMTQDQESSQAPGKRFGAGPKSREQFLDNNIQDTSAQNGTNDENDNLEIQTGLKNNSQTETEIQYRAPRRLVRPLKIGDPVTINLVKKVSDKLKQINQTKEKQSMQQNPDSSTSGQNTRNNKSNRSRYRASRLRMQQRNQHKGTSRQTEQGNRENLKDQSQALKNTSNKSNKSRPKNTASQSKEKNTTSIKQDPRKDDRVFSDLEKNLTYLAEAFNWPQDSSLIMREFVVSSDPPIKAVAIYLEGLADPGRLNACIFEPLMLLSEMSSAQSGAPLLNLVKQRLLPGSAVETKENFTDIIDSISSGSTIIFFQGISQALVVETSGWPRRAVSSPFSERVIRGSQEAFTENLATNSSMIRRLLRDPMLTKEELSVGLRAKNQVAIFYIKDLANPALVKELKRRLQSLEIDGVVNSGALEQLIEDSSWGVYPLSMATERPDRTVAALLDGKIAVLLEGDPFALIYPSTVWSLLQTAEDYGQRGLVATMLKSIRWLAALILLFSPGVYVAVVGYHHEMIPTDLLLAIAANRGQVPLPSIFEILLMEIAFELIREAGVRIPGVIGPTLSIVGAIILGEAAVAARLVNPVVIVIVAIAGICSFAIPSYSLGTALRVYRFGYIFLGGTLGLFGIALGITLHWYIMASLKSLGVPYLAPVAPQTSSNQDVLTQDYLWKQELRQDYLGAQDKYRQSPIARKWILNPKDREE